MPAADLRQAAGLSFSKVLPRALAGTMGADIIAFCEAFKAQFSDATQLDHPTRAWIAIIEAIGAQAGVLLLEYNGGVNGGAIPWLTVMPYNLYQSASSAIYRLCWLANNMQLVGQITVAQGNAILAAYNAHIF